MKWSRSVTLLICVGYSLFPEDNLEREAYADAYVNNFRYSFQERVSRMKGKGKLQMLMEKKMKILRESREKDDDGMDVGVVGRPTLF